MMTDLLFCESPEEQLAVALLQLLGQPSPGPVPRPEIVKKAQPLAHALRKGQKAKAFELSEPLCASLLSAERVAQAYARIADLNIPGNSDYQIVMDCLRQRCEAMVAPAAELSVLAALHVLLLALTRSDKNSISYLRPDPHSGKIRPTSFPLTHTLLDNFIAPFPELRTQALNCLWLQGTQIIGHPAVLIVATRNARWERYQQERAAQEAALKNAPTPPRSLTPPAPTGSPGWISTELEKLLDTVNEPEEQQAVRAALRPTEFYTLMEAARQQDFGQKLQRLYARQLPVARASLLAARMSSRMKRLMAQMGDWKEDTWREFQSLMQTLGVWEGQEWLERWRSGKSGKQPVAKRDQTVAEPTSDSLAEALARQARREDKQRGLKMLSRGELLPWMLEKTRQRPREQQRLLEMLTRSERVEALWAAALPEGLPPNSPELRLRLCQVLLQFSDQDLDVIKYLFLEGLEPELCEEARQMMAAIERFAARMTQILRLEPRRTFTELLERLARQDQETQARERLNSREYQNSVAARYQRFQTPELP
jgi:hypothetical protein